MEASTFRDLTPGCSLTNSLGVTFQLKLSPKTSSLQTDHCVRTVGGQDGIVDLPRSDFSVSVFCNALTKLPICLDNIFFADTIGSNPEEHYAVVPCLPLLFQQHKTFSKRKTPRNFHHSLSCPWDSVVVSGCSTVNFSPDHGAGLVAPDLMIMGVNTLGLVAGSYYSYIFYQFSRNKVKFPSNSS